MKPGDTILILPSCALTDLHIDKLAGMMAVVSEIIEHDNKIHGCWVTLSVKFMGEYEWYIPYSSIG